MNKRFQFFILAFLPLLAAAQTQGPDMADAFRADGKINIVLAVIAIIFLCLAAFLVYLERRISKVEKQTSEKQSTTK